MNRWQLDEVSQATKGQILSRKTETFQGLGTDTRKSLSGQLFWALKGESFDAHQFLSKAIEQGAAGLVVHEKPSEEILTRVSVILVPDTLRALQDFANFMRKKKPAKVIGITGSNGKTTSKEFCQQVLSSKFLVHSNKGSFNNHFGLPFNLLDAPADAEFVLAEMGMNHFGEITRLCEIAEPDVVVCTMVGRAHIEHFGSIDAIAKAKEEIYQSAPSAAIRIYNLDNPWTEAMWKKALRSSPQAGKILTFSENKTEADVCFRRFSMSMRSLRVEGKISGTPGVVEVPVFGSQNLTNLLVASTVALACQMKPEEIWKALPRCRTSWGRNQFVATQKGAEILFDAYNANPDSMRALLENVPVLETHGKKVGVFAEMLELGELAPQAHRELGALAGQSGFEVLYFYGPHSADFEAGLKDSKFSKKSFVSSAYEESLASLVASMLEDGDLALVKGSRGMKLERFVQLCNPIGFEAK